MAPLQKRALFTSIIGLVFASAVVVALSVKGGVSAFDRDLSLRLVTYAALIGIPLTYLILIDLTLHKPTQLDERDRLIVLRSRPGPVVGRDSLSGGVDDSADGDIPGAR